jgi:hypothetical protein
MNAHRVWGGRFGLVLIMSVAFAVAACGGKKDKDGDKKTDDSSKKGADKDGDKGDKGGEKTAIKPVTKTDLGSKSGADWSKMEAPNVSDDKLKKGVNPAEISKDGIPAPMRGFNNVKQTGFRVAYAQSSDPMHEQFRMAFQKERAFEVIAEELNKTLKMDTVVDIHLVDCGTVNAFYDPNNKRMIICYELISYFLDMFKDTASSEQELGMAVVGATFFGFFHELGHGLIDIFDLPAVGREEDAVDQMATLVLMEGGDEGVQMALAGAQWFLLQGSQNADVAKMPFWDEHAFDKQRFYNIICLVYGSNTEKYGGFVKEGHLPEDRAVRCPEEFKDISRAWDRLLAPHLRDGASMTGTGGSGETKQPAGDGHDGHDHGDMKKDPTPPTGGGQPVAGGTSCEDVTMKVIELIIADTEANLVANNATEEQINAVAEELKNQIPTIATNLMEACAQEAWPEPDKQCVMKSKSVAEAEKCGT